MDMFLFVSLSSTKEQYVRAVGTGVEGPPPPTILEEGIKTFPPKGLGLLLAAHPPRFSDLLTAL